MDYKEMTIEQLEERKAAIVAELDAPEADLDALETYRLLECKADT